MHHQRYLVATPYATRAVRRNNTEVRKQKKPLWLAEAPRAKNTTLQPLAKIPPTAWPENTAPM